MFDPLVDKASNLETLEINGIMSNHTNKEVMLKVALNLIKKSSQLRTLILSKTNTETQAGRQFLAALMDLDFNTLETLDLNCPDNDKMYCKWFDDGADEPVFFL